VGVSVGDRAPWPVALIAGAALFLLGLLMLTLPDLTATLAIRFIGLFWLIDGVVGLVCIFFDRAHWGWKLLAGLLSVVGGILVIQHPLWTGSLSAIASGLAIGVIGILIGLVQLILAMSGSGWRTGAPGVVSLLFGCLVAFIPMLGAVLLPIMLAGLALAGGVAATIAAFKRRADTRRRSMGASSTSVPG
jgi:uncharacterized membrane protein HdeD (DUF308 family)